MTAVRRAWAAALAACTLVLATRARAAEPSVSIATPPGATCVEVGELVDALRRAGIAAHASAPDAGDSENVAVTLDGTPAALVVGMKRHGADVSQALPAATCETATDAVAAFLTSALAPALVPPPPAATQGASVAAPAARVKEAPRPEPVEPARLHALRDAFDRVPRREPNWILPSLELLVGAMAISGPSVARASQRPLSAFDATALYAGGAVLVGGGVGGFVLGRDRGTDFMLTAFFAGEGFFFATSIVPSSSVGRVSRTAGFFGAAVLASSNLAHGRPLERVHAESDEVRGDGLTRARAGAIEGDLRQVDPPVPLWLASAPPVAGFTVAAVADLTNKRVPPVYGSIDVLFAGTELWYLLIAAGNTVWGPYERALHKAGLKTLALGPGPAAAGLSLTGSF